jgi:opacity protein-like surface antigen
MKKISLAFAVSAAVAAATAAYAQPQSPDDWTGPYIGLNLGWDNPMTTARPSTVTVNQLSGLNTGGGGTATVPSTTLRTSRMDYDDSYRTGGMQVGFNHQMGMFVLGLEGDVDAQGNERFSQGSSYTLPATALTTGSLLSVNRYTFPYLTSTVRGRAGVAFGRLLVYGTGGLAIGEVRQETDYGYEPTATAAVAAANPPSDFGVFRSSGSNRYLRTGWTAGGGVEWRIGRTISLGAEYRHMDFGSAMFQGGVNAPTGVYETARLHYGDNQALAKLNFHF